MREEKTYSGKAIFTQREAAKHLGVSRHRFAALEKAGYFKRLHDSNNGVSYRLSDLERFLEGTQTSQDGNKGDGR